MVDSLCWLFISKPRPDFLARCQPDLSQINNFLVGGLGYFNESSSLVEGIPGAPIFVTLGICQGDHKELRKQGFSAFPSGHVAFAFAGSLYLFLWLCNWHGLGSPFCERPRHTTPTMERKPSTFYSRIHDFFTIGVQPAAPAILGTFFISHLLLLSVFVSTTRYGDHRHGGFDVIFSAVYGCFIGWLGFRLYHPSLASGIIGPWGPRVDHPENWPAHFLTKGTIHGEVYRDAIDPSPKDGEKRVGRDEEEGPIDEIDSHPVEATLPNNRRGQTWG